jgi:hypothetical protein
MIEIIGINALFMLAPSFPLWSPKNDCVSYVNIRLQDLKNNVSGFNE